VLFETLRVTGYGVLAGLGVAWLLAEAASPELFGVRPTDPATFGGVTALVLLVAAVSVWGPIVHAMRVDPSTALRVD
jgi:ABC-type antimicrobial peptide transport system permease subunit